MGWVTDLAPGHEGWVAMVVDDGREASCSSRDGVVFFLPGGGEEVVPWERVVAWRGRCECGWVGPEHAAIDDSKGWRDCPEDIADSVFLPAWQEHIAPVAAPVFVNPDRQDTNEQTLAAALAPFGWTCGPEFWERYYSDPWVFNLANAVERLSRERRDA